MNRNTTMTLLLALTLAAGGVGFGCGQPAGTQGVKTYAPPTAAPDATYTTRAVIEQLPEAGKPQTQLRCHHEAVDDFKNAEGKVVGMSAMVMDFPPAKGVSLDGLKVGDKVLMTWSVWWEHTPNWLAMKIVKLPDDTVLEFRAKKPIAAEGTPK
jgi:Cu/Ag efflux protein CusF